MPSSRFIGAVMTLALCLCAWVALMRFEPSRATISAIRSKAKTADTHTDQPPLIYGHVHVAKTGGTSLNVLLANKYQRVCGHKGYSYDAYSENERAKERREGRADPRKNYKPQEMDEIGYEECDYVSHEREWRVWNETFPGGTLHGVPVELHVPCRDPVDHVMSMCNHQGKRLNCSASSDQEFYRSIDRCGLYMGRFVRGHQVRGRFHNKLLSTFNVRCFGFDRQFTAYADHMSRVLQRRRFESAPIVTRATNNRRNREAECIWKREDLAAKAARYLTEKYDYYGFCDKCMGTSAEIAGNYSK